ncbi:hypothetical protein ACN47E_007531 [Coniothyrium glycines]
MADPKAAPLADDLKELVLSLPTSALPKSMLCALCTQPAIDAYKLLCCNKSICASCQANLHFPTTCPSCDHSPLEADSCVPNKSARNTMRVWLQKHKKREEAKAAAQAAPQHVEATSAAPEVQSAGSAAETSLDSAENALKSSDVGEQEPNAGEVTGNNGHRAGSASAQPNEDAVLGETNQIQHGSTEPAAANDERSGDQAGAESGMEGIHSMMNGVQGQMGYFPTPAGFANGLGWNGMNAMNSMPNMMANGSYNSMDFNMNGMYGNFGGNMGMGMGMGMNDMSAMNMMNYNGGFGNSFNGMGGGYGNFNGPNQMGGYNQSGAYPEMMNQFPKNNFSNQNQNRFHASQGGAVPQRNRTSSQGNPGLNSQNAQSRPGSRSGPAHNQRDGQLSNENANPASEAKGLGEQTNASVESTEGLQDDAPSDDAKTPTTHTNRTGDHSNEPVQGGGLNAIQTFDSGDGDGGSYDQSMAGNVIHQNMPYAQGMINQFPNQQMNASFDTNMNMNMNMGYSHQNSFAPRSGFDHGAYGAARVLTGPPAEPIGVGVVGAPTGPRAMREGRPNTGFSSRMNSTRFAPQPLKTVASAQENVAANSPQRRVRSKSPQRDESLRVQQRSPSRSRSPSASKSRDAGQNDHRERSHSAERGPRRGEQARSVTPQDNEEPIRRRDHRHHRPARSDEVAENFDNDDDRYRDDRGGRSDRTRTASVDSKYRNNRREKEKHRSSRSRRDRSKEHRHRYRSRSPRESKYDDENMFTNGGKDSDDSSRHRQRNTEKEKYREREKERERDRRDRKERDRDHDYDREKERSRDKDKDRRRRRERETGDDEYDDDDVDKRSSRRSRSDREREREKDRGYDVDERKERSSRADKEEDIVGQMMKKRAVSPPLNAPTGPAANGFSIKGRSKNAVMPPPQPPSGPRATTFQPPKGPAADRVKDRSNAHHRRKSSVGSNSSITATSTAPTPQDHYAAERERNARERDSRERGSSTRDASSNHKTLSSRAPQSSSSHPSLSSKRARDAVEHDDYEARIPKGPKADARSPPTGPAGHGHRDKRRKSGTATGDDGIVGLFTAGLRKKNAKSGQRRGGVRMEGDVERDMEARERDRERR